MAQQNFDENFQRQTSSQDHSSRSGTNNNNASMMMMNGQNINYNGGYGMNVNSMNHHRGGNMMNMGMGMHSAMMMNSSRNFPQDSNNNMFSNNDMNGMMMMNSSRMMGGGGGGNGMRFNSYNDSSSRGSSMNDNFGGGGGGGYQGSGNGMGGGFNGCMELGGNATNNNGPSRFNNDNYDSNSMGHRGGGRGANQQGGGYPQDSNQGYDRFNSNGSDEYCQPLSSQGQQNHPQGVGQQGDPRIPSSAGGGNSGGGGGGSPGGGQDTPDDSARSNAVFKQQVATMAMNEASTAFKDMEDAFAHAKSVMAQSREAHPEDDPCVIQANAHAKKCQSVAMFKLKVSQRASEEAAGAYESYQTMVGGSPGSGNSPVPLMGGRGLIGGGRDFSR